MCWAQPAARRAPTVLECSSTAARIQPLDRRRDAPSAILLPTAPWLRAGLRMCVWPAAPFLLQRDSFSCRNTHAFNRVLTVQIPFHVGPICFPLHGCSFTDFSSPVFPSSQPPLQLLLFARTETNQSVVPPDLLVGSAIFTAFRQRILALVAVSPCWVPLCAFCQDRARATRTRERVQPGQDCLTADF